MSQLPIAGTLPAVRAALGERGAAVLVAPPGAGKTTAVPLALLGEPWLEGRRIIMLEPRRLAARAAARYMAAQLGERVGDTVGYRMRMETRVGPRTRVEVVTEGVLTRLLHADPALEDAGLLIFDEFHERSVHADFGLALALQSRALLRPDLRLLVMSATIEGARVAALMGDAPVIASEGRAFPVETRHIPRRREIMPEAAVAQAVRLAVAREPGDVLVFLPGAAEIRRVASLLDADPPAQPVTVYPLHGTLPTEMQEEAIAPSPPGRRKVVLASAIAETSLTIEGVRVVIDAGLARVARFSPRTGMTRLETVRVSRASAEQRRGRAGRVAPGVCYRLWSEDEESHLVPHGLPEILEADLAPLALELAVAGIADPSALRWMDPPPAAAFSQARELLAELDAIDGAGRATAHGRRMAELAMHPRLAHMVLAGAAQGRGVLACEIAALLAERDILRGIDQPPETDLRPRVDLLRAPESRAPGGAAVAHGARRLALRQARAWAAQLGVGPSRAGDDLDAIGVLLALAYPDRVARRRPGVRGHFVLRHGGGAWLPETDALAGAEFIVAAELDGRRPESRVFRAAPLDESDVRALFGADVATEDVVEWDDVRKVATARRRERLGAIVLRESVIRDPDPERVRAARVDAVRRAGLGALRWTDGARRLRDRLAFLHALDDSWPDVSDEALLGAIETWLGPRLDGSGPPDIGAALLDLLTWEQRAALDTLAPTHIDVPSGSRVPVDYTDARSPALAVRLQEMFGLTDTPRIARGAVSLTLHLLSPAGRPVQVTRDLAGFWRGAYHDVRKDLRGRYPKHEWPDDPLRATPTSRAKRRR